jgi:hypothetical protein
MTTNVEGPEERCVAHQGLVLAGAAVQGTRRRWPGGGSMAALADRLQQRGSGSLACVALLRGLLRR